MSQATLSRPVGMAKAVAGATGLHVEVAATDLAREVSFVSQVIARRPPVPVLAGVQIRAEHGGLRLTAHDFMDTASSVVPAPGATGAALLPAGQLLRMLRAIGKADVTIHTDWHSARITGAGVTYQVPVLPLAEWPEPVEGADHLVAVLPLAARQQLRRTLVAAAFDETLPTLTAVHLHVHEQNLAAHCTDRYRLTAADALAPALAMESGGWLLPARVARLALRYLPPKSDLHVLVSTPPEGGPTPPAASALAARRPAGLMRLDAGHRSITASLTYGEYPKVRALFPDEPSWSVTFDRLDLLTAVRQVAVAGDQRPIQLIPQPGRATVQLAVGDREQPGSGHADVTSSAVKEVAAADVEGEMSAMAFNAQYLIDALANALGDTVVVTGTLSTKLIVIVATEDPSFRHLLMPVRLAD